MTPEQDQPVIRVGRGVAPSPTVGAVGVPAYDTARHIAEALPRGRFIPRADTKF